MPIDLSRRHLLFLGTAVVPACDRLVLPPEDFLDEIAPITPTDEFYRYSHAGRPMFDIATWTCDFEDRGSVVASIDASFFEGRAPVEFEHTLQCIGSGPRLQNISNAIFGGMPFDELLDELGIAVDASIVELGFEGADGYHDSFPIEDLDKPVWLVWEINGEPLPEGNGAPCRLIVPGRYGIKNVKWPSRLLPRGRAVHSATGKSAAWDEATAPTSRMRSSAPRRTWPPSCRGETVDAHWHGVRGRGPRGHRWRSPSTTARPGSPATWTTHRVANIWALWRCDLDARAKSAAG